MLRDLALEAARAGAAAIEETRRAGALSVDSKGSPNDLVTSADRASEQAIIERIRAARPDDALLGEETGEHPGRSGVRWLIDPLDGTTNFVHGRRDWAVAVAAEADGEVLAGAIVRPAFGEWAAADERGTVGSMGAPAVSGARRLDRALICVGVTFDPDLREETLGLLVALLPHVRDFRRAGSASTELFTVATGALDAYVGVQTSPWDLGAGWALVRGAGGRCVHTRTAGGRAAHVAGAPAVAEALVPLVERHPG